VTAMMASVSVWISVSGTMYVEAGMVQLMSEAVVECWSMTSVLRGWYALEIGISCSLEYFTYAVRSFFLFQGYAAALGPVWIIQDTATVAAGPGLLCLV
jgi:hypothetical protein